MEDDMQLVYLLNQIYRWTVTDSDLKEMAARLERANLTGRQEWVRLFKSRVRKVPSFDQRASVIVILEQCRHATQDFNLRLTFDYLIRFLQDGDARYLAMHRVKMLDVESNVTYHYDHDNQVMEIYYRRVRIIPLRPDIDFESFRLRYLTTKENELLNGQEERYLQLAERVDAIVEQYRHAEGIVAAMARELEEADYFERYFSLQILLNRRYYHRDLSTEVEKIIVTLLEERCGLMEKDERNVISNLSTLWPHFVKLQVGDIFTRQDLSVPYPTTGYCAIDVVPMMSADNTVSYRFRYLQEDFVQLRNCFFEHEPSSPRR
jgi:hypothetical protein